MATLEYLKAKAAEYVVILSRISQGLQLLKSQTTRHQWLLAYLQSQIQDAQKQHRTLESILKLGHARVLRRAEPIVHDIEYSIYKISVHYLPALQKEGKPDLIFRDLLLTSAQKCGLFWIKDIVVHLDGSLATVPAPPEAPLIIAPPYHAVSLLDLPGLYHELGHDVFQQFSQIESRLSTVVIQYFKVFSRRAGPMDPTRKAERDEKIRQAVQYWNQDRLNEIFCDIFGTYVCGPAQYISCVDMGLKFGEDPYCLDLQDEHPPTSSRVHASYKVLIQSQQSEQAVTVAYAAWVKHTKAHTQNYSFNFFCATSLLDELVEEAISCIEDLIPNIKRYKSAPATANPAEPIQADTLLEDILNQAVKILMTHPDLYFSWEPQTLKTLGF